MEMTGLNRMKFGQRFLLLLAVLFFSYSVCTFLQIPHPFFILPHRLKRSSKKLADLNTGIAALSQAYRWNKQRDHEGDGELYSLSYEKILLSMLRVEECCRTK